MIFKHIHIFFLNIFVFQIQKCISKKSIEISVTAVVFVSPVLPIRGLTLQKGLGKTLPWIHSPFIAESL